MGNSESTEELTSEEEFPRLPDQRKDRESRGHSTSKSSKKSSKTGDSSTGGGGIGSGGQRRTVAQREQSGASTSAEGSDLLHRIYERDTSTSSQDAPGAPAVPGLLDASLEDGSIPSVSGHGYPGTAAMTPAEMSEAEFERAAHESARLAADRASQLIFSQFATDPLYATMTGGQAQLEVQARAQKAWEIAYEHQLSYFYAARAAHMAAAVGVGSAVHGSMGVDGSGAMGSTAMGSARRSPAMGASSVVSGGGSATGMVASSAHGGAGGGGGGGMGIMSMPGAVEIVESTTSAGHTTDEMSGFTSGGAYDTLDEATLHARGVTNTWRDKHRRTSAAELISTIFTWPHGGRDVYLCHSGDGWKHKYRMHRSHDDFSLILDLKPGVYHYKFIVDSTWRCAPDQRLVRDSSGAYSNVMEVRSTSFATIEERRKRKKSAKEFSCEIPTRESFIQEPPAMPPHLTKIVLNGRPKVGDHPLTLDKPERVTLNHLHVADKSSEGVVTIGMTERFKDKFVTTVFYKAIDSGQSIDTHKHVIDGFWAQ